MRDRPGRKNVYTCGTCGGEIVTIDQDAGTTPAFMICRVKEDCGGRMTSAWYEAGEDREPTHAWYEPTEEELEEICKDAEYPEGIQSHVDAGGLLLKEIES